MVDPNASARWGYRLLFVALATAIVLVRLVPFGENSPTIPPPDLLLCLTLVWFQRRPDYAPVLLTGAVLLAADLLLMRPPGLAAALTLIGAEFLRRQRAAGQDNGFLDEWAMAAGVILAIDILCWLINTIVAAPTLALNTMLLGCLSSIAAYPVVQIVSRHLFNVRRGASDRVRRA